MILRLWPWKDIDPLKYKQSLMRYLAYEDEDYSHVKNEVFNLIDWKVTVQLRQVQ